MSMQSFLLLIGLVLASSLGGTASGQTIKNSAQGDSATTVSTPAQGSAERKAILDVLRRAAKKMSGLDVIFVVTHLKAGNGWAWVQAEPQSVDGSQHYETMSGLLHRVKGRWVFVEGPPEAEACDEDPDCADPVRYFQSLAKKHPGAPAGIFPKPD